MKSEYCEHCFRTIYSNADPVSICISCGKIYYTDHLETEGVCNYCSGTRIQVYEPKSGTVKKAVSRKPIKLKRIHLDNSSWEASDYIAWSDSLLRASIRVIIGIFVATIIGVYTFRLLGFQAYSDPVKFFSHVIQDGFPSRTLFIIALITSMLGASVFFPTSLPGKSTKHSFNRRLGRLFAVLILLVSMNLLLFNLVVSDVLGILKSEVRISFGEYGLSLIAAQGGALFTTMVAGTVIRSSNASAYERDYPRNLSQGFKAISVIRFYVVSLVVAALAFLLTISLLSSHSIAFYLLKIGEWLEPTNHIYLVALNATILGALLLYLPPSHSAAHRRWWLFRLIGCGIALMNIFNYYRSANTIQLEAILQATFIALLVTISFIPVQRAFS